MLERLALGEERLDDGSQPGQKPHVTAHEKLQGEYVETRSFRSDDVPAHGVDLSSQRHVAEQHEGDRDETDPDYREDRQAVGDAVRVREVQHADLCELPEPGRKVVYPLSPGDELQDPEKHVQCRDGDDDRRCVQEEDEGGVTGAEGNPDHAGHEKDEKRGRARAPGEDDGHDVLRNGGVGGEGNVDAARQQHHQHPDREDSQKGVAPEDVEGVLEGDEVRIDH
jgi:hypothetical protein